MKFPRITIVTPVFNRDKYLEQTILSVINQGYPNLEYIIVDGGSSDNSVEIIKKYESFLSFWISEPDNGMYHALQKGFDKSTGDIMAWINSDDKYQPGAFFNVANIFTDLVDVDWIFGMPALFDKNGYCVKITKSRTWSKERFFIGDYKWIQQENTFWRRGLWSQAGGRLDLNYKYAADLELWARFFEFKKLYNIETSFAGFRIHGSQLSVVNSEAYELESSQIYNSKIRSYFPGRYLIMMKMLYKWQNKNKFPFFKLLRTFTSIIINKRLGSHLIYFDFISNKWTKSR